MRRTLAHSVVVVLVGCSGAPVPPFPPPPAQPITPFAVSVDDVVRTCAMEVSCLTSPPITSRCVADFEYGIAGGNGYFTPASELRRFVACAVAATDCNSALVCASRGHGPTYCAAHPGDSCDGQIAVSCSSADWTIATTDCAALGIPCHGGRCDGGRSSASWYCDGNLFVGDISYDCARFAAGYSCRPQPANTLTSTLCWPSGPACTTSVCNGNVADDCLSGEIDRVDCGAFASHCVLDARYAHTTCVPDATDCDDASARNRCNGDLLQQCANGSWRDFDCTTIGLGRCTATTDGARCS